MKRSTIIEIIIFLYAVLFLYTAVSKIIDFEVFKQQLSESPVLTSLAPFIAIGIPAAELLLILLLVVPRWRLKGIYGSLIMMLSFTLYVIAILTFSDKLPCSCGGVISKLSWSQHIFLNSTFIAMAIVAIILEKRERNDAEKSWRQLRASRLEIS